MSPSLADRLTQACHNRFVGRDGELSVFESASRSEFLPFYVLDIFGPGSVGKTTLLQEFALLSECHSARAIYLDARNIDLSPDAFINSLGSLLITTDLSFPKTLGYLGILSAILMVILYLGRLIALPATSLVIVVPALLEGFIVIPTWYIWLGLTMSRSQSQG